MNEHENTIRYIELHEKLPALTEFAKTGELGAMALERAHEQIEALAQDEIVQSDLVAIVEKTERQITEVTQQSVVAVELGLIEQSEVDAQLDELRNRTEYRVAKKSGTIAMKDTVEPISASTDEVVKAEEVKSQAQPELQKEKTCIEMTLHGNGLQVGKRGKFIKLSSRTHDKQADYSTYRRKALRALIENQGSMLSVADLWENIAPDQEFDRHISSQIRTWLNSITFRGSNVIQHNGKRGPSSAYGIIDFDVELNELTTVKPTAVRSSDESQLDTKPENVGHEGLQAEEADRMAKDDSKLKSQPTKSTASQKREASKPQKEALTAPTPHFPLSLAESLIFAEVLETYSVECARSGIAKLDSKIPAELKKVTSTERLMLAMQGRDILEVRKDITSKVITYFENERQVLQDIELMNEKDHRRKLFEYLYEIDWEERQSLIKAIVGGDTILEVVTGGKNGTEVVSARIVEADQITRTDGGSRYIADGEEIIIDHEPEVSVESVTQDPEQDVIGDQSAEADLEDELVVEDTVSEEVAEEPKVISVKGKAAKTKDSDPRIEQKEQQLLEIETYLREALTEIREKSLSGSTTRNLRTVFPFMSPRFVKNASENGHITHSTKGVDERDILALVALHGYKREYSLAKSSASAIVKKDIEKVIHKLIEEKTE